MISVGVSHLLEHPARHVIEGGRHGSHVDLGARFDGVGEQVELSHGILEVVMVENDTQATGQCGGVSHDPIGFDGHEIRARCRQVHQAGDHRLVGLGLESPQFLGHHVAGGHATAGAVDPEHDRRDLRIARRGVQLVAKGRQRIVANGIETAVILVQEDSVDVDQGDSSTGRGDTARPNDLGRHLARIDRSGKLDVNRPPHIGVSHDTGIAPEGRGDRQGMAATGNSERRESSQHQKADRTPVSQPARDGVILHRGSSGNAGRRAWLERRPGFTIGWFAGKLVLIIRSGPTTGTRWGRPTLMRSITFAIWLAAIGAEPTQVEPGHAKNSVYVGVLEQGLNVDGQTLKLPEARLRDSQAADDQRDALRALAGPDRALDELVRNAVTAPYLIKVRDVKTATGTIRVVDLWFVVHADLDQVDPAKEAARTDGKEVEAGNMAVQTRLLKGEDLRAAGIAPAPGTSSQSSWYAHIHGRLLDRIEFDVTNEIVATQTDGSIVIAARTSPAFKKPGPNANGWRSVPPHGGANAEATLEPYAGGISYTKISRLAFKPGALLVEMHAAFVEPKEWFQGAPILRSKFSIIAQDQIRALRREVAKRRAK